MAVHVSWSFILIAVTSSWMSGVLVDLHSWTPQAAVLLHLLRDVRSFEKRRRRVPTIRPDRRGGYERDGLAQQDPTGVCHHLADHDVVPGLLVVQRRVLGGEYDDGVIPLRLLVLALVCHPLEPDDVVEPERLLDPLADEGEFEDLAVGER